MRLLGPHGYGGSIAECKKAGAKPEEQQRENYFGDYVFPNFCGLAFASPF